MFIDEMNYETCWDLWRAIQSSPVLTARKMFPNRPPMYVVITKKIGQYMANKGTALGSLDSPFPPDLNLEDIKTERRGLYTGIAAKIWTEIPAWARSFNIDFLKEK